mgnify:CR=1 FL=1
MDKRENSEYVLKILFLVMTVLFSYVIIHCLNAWDTLQVEGYGGLSDAINMGLKHLKEKPFQIRYSNSVKNNLWVIGLVIFVAYGLLFFNRHVTLFGREFGSARWANRKEERAFADKEEKKNVIMSMNIRMSLNPRVSKRNLNILLVGGSGAGKTRYFVKPNIMQMNCSYIITDPKGDTFKSTAKMLEDAGYEVILFNLFEKGNSACYNFFSYIHKESDILKLATLLIRGTKPAEQQNAASDPFWDNAGILLAEAFIGYIWLEEKEERKNMETFMELLSQASASEEDENQKSCVDEKFERLEKEHGSNYFPCKQYNLYKKAAGKTAKSILITLGASLSAFNLKEIIELTRTDTLHLESLGDKKKALFILISDTDKSMNFLVSMLYTQLFDELSFRADFGEVKWTEGQTYYHSRYSLIDKREDLEKLYKEYISAEGDKKRDRLYQKIYQKMDEIEEEFGIPPLKERVISEEVIDKYIHAINDLSRRMNRKKEQLKVYYKNLVHVNKALSLIQQSKGEVRRNVKSIEQKEIDKFKRLKDIIHRRLLYEYGISAEYKGKDAEEKFLGDINLLIKELYKNDNLYGSEKTLRERIEYVTIKKKQMEALKKSIKEDYGRSKKEKRKKEDKKKKICEIEKEINVIEKVTFYEFGIKDFSKKMNGGSLPVHVRCLLDEFRNITPIPDFQQIIATIRSRNISATIILQNLAQLKEMYKDAWENISGNCDTFVFLGGQEQQTLEYVSKKLGKLTLDKRSNGLSRGTHGSSSENWDKLGRELKTADEIGRMDNNDCMIFIRGMYPYYTRKYDLKRHKQYKKLCEHIENEDDPNFYPYKKKFITSEAATSILLDKEKIENEKLLSISIDETIKASISADAFMLNGSQSQKNPMVDVILKSARKREALGKQIIKNYVDRELQEAEVPYGILMSAAQTFMMEVNEKESEEKEKKKVIEESTQEESIEKKNITEEILKSAIPFENKEKEGEEIVVHNELESENKKELEEKESGFEDFEEE